jgi:hypothetical protein
VKEVYNLIDGKEFFEGGSEAGEPGKEGFSIETGVAPKLQWYNKDASDYVYVVMRRYGAPSAVDPTAGGIAIWKKDKLMNTPFDRIEVKDESIPHLHPARHNDFVYMYVNYDVMPSKYMEVTSLSGSIVYDPLKKLLRSRCGTMEATVATLALATQIGEGHISLNYAQANELFAQYIMASQHPEQYNRLHDLLAYNLKHQHGDPTSDGYWPPATGGTNHPSPYNLHTM